MSLWLPSRSILQPREVWRRGRGGGAAPTATTWDSGKAEGVTLSNGDLTIAGTASTGFWNGAESVAGKSTGKYYFEYTCDNDGGITAWNFVGFSDGSENSHLGSSTSPIRSFGWSGDGKAWLGGSNPTTSLSTFNTGDTVAVAVDVDNLFFWTKNITDAGSWNNASADPAAGTGYIDMSSSGLATLYAAATVGFSSAGFQGTAHFSSGSWAESAPSGFSQISA